MTGRAFSKVLIANRGEIARRIALRLRAMGLSSVAIYSDVDAGAPHVRSADEAVRIGGSSSAESYLSIERVLEAARKSGAEAVHPGYGFLSERAEFARACTDAGLVFIGPSADAIARMGSKIESKRIAAAAGVPVIEGFSLAGLSLSEVIARANALGYPLLVKASAGGGGRGMRIVHAHAELEGALASAEREAQAAFGDGSLLVERYLQGPRHIEIQIFGDEQGNLVHLFERECSIQRRHQKVIEEAPSPSVDAALRARMGDAAVSLARAIGYSNAGTVELVLDRSGAFYFLEVNTRLQVEHPVTEAITGLDLVRLQVEVAMGKPLPFSQAELAIKGHAIEARLYAEDAARDFLPATGTLALYVEPEQPGLRIDSGVEAGSEVSVHYDPMLAKVICSGASRDEARLGLARALRGFALGGVVTNRDFLVQVLEHERFAAGALHTGFIDEHLPASKRAQGISSAEVASHAIAATLFLHAARRGAESAIPASIPSGYRNNPSQLQVERFTLGEQALDVRYAARAGRVFEVELNGQKLRAELIDASTSTVTAEIDGVRRTYMIARDEQQVHVHGAGRSVSFVVVPRFPPSVAAQVAGGCVAPMTGIVRKVFVAEGEQVAQGAPLLVLEAMKMEHRMLAHASGIVRSVRVREGQMVDPDEVLVVVEEESPA